MRREELRDLSDRLEAQTGFDSIATIERVYERHGRRSQQIGCPHSGCRVIKPSPEQMWYHVHFSRTHGYSFGVKAPRELVEPDSDG